MGTQFSLHETMTLTTVRVRCLCNAPERLGTLGHPPSVWPKESSDAQNDFAASASLGRWPSCTTEDMTKVTKGVKRALGVAQSGCSGSLIRPWRSLVGCWLRCGLHYVAAFFPCGDLLAELKLLSARVLIRAQKGCVLSGNGAGSGLIQLAVVANCMTVTERCEVQMKNPPIV